ncbi:unnamed protein product [Victoria cruziana]
MVNRRDPYFLAMAVALMAAALATGEVVAYSSSGVDVVGWAAAWPACGGAGGTCLEAEEMAVDSENNRRILQDTSHLSYESLLRGSVTCGHPGSPYSNCRPSVAVNPYTRPCADITGCARYQFPATSLEV